MTVVRTSVTILAAWVALLSGVSVETAAAAAGDPVATLAGMSLDQQVGEVFMVGGPATGVGPGTVSAVRDRHVGSVILTGRSTLGVLATAGISAGLQALATPAATRGVKFLVAVDQEGGQVQVLRGSGFSDIPSALVQGQVAPATLRQQAAGWGGQLAAAGVNVDLAPVLDTVPSAAAAATNPPIGFFDREYGYTPDTVASHGSAFAQGMADAGVVATGKHFPGLGRVTANTDTTAGVTDTVTVRNDAYVQPFAAAVGTRQPMLMISSAYYSRIDAQHPAAFSSTVIDGMVRGDLGFQGVVVSDDLANARQVAAWSPGDRALQFLAAGGDLVLTVDPAQLPAMYDAVLTRARSVPGFRARVAQAALRVLRLKQTRGLLPPGPSPAPPGTLDAGSVMTGGQWVRSPNGRYGLTLQPDGNLVSYAPGDRPLWSSVTYGHPGDVAAMQSDGNLVVYAGDGSVLWNSGTWADPGAVLRVQDDGNVVLYRTDGSAAWSTGWDRTGLSPGQQLSRGQQVTSPNGRYWLVLQGDGNVVAYCRDGRVLFFSGSYGSSRLVLQTDGNLVAYRSDGTAAWASGTWREGPSRLAVQDDGNVVLYRSDGTAAWSTGWDTGGRATSPGNGTFVPRP
ncbi:MAG: beta-N-acetylhexosaminidase [Blastococcus sp.]|nr:beta-N-acetylhexosaminidase [Blastococcus sp.]